MIENNTLIEHMFFADSFERSLNKRMHMLLILVAALFTFGIRSSYASPQSKELLIINSYNESAPWVQDYITPFMQKAAETDGLNCNMVHMNSTLIRTDSMYNQVKEGIFNRFRDNHPNYLVLIGKMAFSLRKRIKSEWGDIPILVIGAGDKIAEDEMYLTGDSSFLKAKQISLSDIRDQYNFTYIEIPDLYRETIDMMVRMQPGMKKLVFASDELVTNMDLDKKIREYLSTTYPDLEYERLVASATSRMEMQQYLMSRDLSVGILLSSWYYSRPSVFGYPILVTGDFNLISTTSRPIFSVKENYLDAGAVGGCFIDREAILSQFLSVLQVMLASGNMRELPFTYPSKKAYKVNYERLKVAMIPESRCPEGTVFINKPKTMWELYSWQIVSGGIVLAAILCMLGGFILFQRKRMAYMAARNKLVENMPVSYMTGKIISDKEGKRPTDIVFTAGNRQADTLAADNTEDGDINKLFDKTYILTEIEKAMQTKVNGVFTYYFDGTDSYYDFRICQTLHDDELEFFGVDVTSKVKSEQSLSETTKTLEVTLSVAHIIPWKWDLKKRIIACEASRILQHLNFPKHAESTMETKIVDEDEYFKRIHPEDVQAVRKIHDDFLNGRIQYAKSEFRIVTENKGKAIVDWMEVNVSVSQYGEDGKPAELIGSLLLITGRKRQEANLIAAKEAAKESDRLKSAFIANMSHEIHTPLNAIIGFSNLLAITDDQDERNKFFGIIEKNNELLLQLISDILDLSKVEANTLDFLYKPTNLNELLHDIEMSVKSKVPEGVMLNCVKGLADCYIDIEPTRLTQVLNNLLINACKFTSKGSITMGYELHEDDMLYFYVRDTGCGIPKEGQERIFQRFVKLNDFIQGTGLGLSICQTIVDKMHGKIGVYSQGEGTGSTFWFTVPYKPAAIEMEAKPAEAEKEMIERDNVTILVAEDNESNYILIESLLGNRYKLVHAWDGIEAVELFKKHSPQLIIMDINMPRMDGYEATHEIRKISTSVPIIAVTAYAYSSDKQKIMENGFNSYVSKPIDAKTLNEKLKSALTSHFIFL